MKFKMTVAISVLVAWALMSMRLSTVSVAAPSPVPEMQTKAPQSAPSPVVQVAPQAKTAEPAIAKPAAPAEETVAPKVVIEATPQSTGDVDLNSASADSLAQLRDPFQRPKIKAAQGPVAELERYPLDQFELIGVITGPNRIRAMVRDPKQKTHLITLKTKIGNRNGKVRKITPVSVFVREKIMNVFGKEESADVEIRLSRPGNKQAPTGSEALKKEEST